jgi:hypothetical protein
MATVLKVLLPCELRLLTLHSEEPAGAKIFWGLLPIKHQCHPSSLQLKHDVFVFSFCPALNLSFKIFLLFCILFAYMTLLMGDIFY